MDCGLRRLGVATITYDKDFQLREAEVIEQPRDRSLTFNAYLNQSIHKLCESWPEFLHKSRPDFIVAEIIPVGRLGSNSELNVAAITVCKTIAFNWGIDWHDIAANTVKKELTDDGLASKIKIRNAVWELFPHLKNEHEKQKEIQKTTGEASIGLPPDLYDAVGIAYVGLKKHGGINGEEEA